MKKTNFLKTLLIAVAAMGGVNCAWATEVPYNVGTSTDATYLSAYSDVWEMTGDGVVEVTFTNHNKTDVSNWFNWHLICGNATDQPTDGDVNTNRYFVMRADRWDNVAGSAAGFWVSDNYFTDFMTYQNGATVTIKIVRYGTTVNVYTTATKDAVEHTMGYVKTGIPADQAIKFYLTGSSSYMEVTAQDQSTDVAGETMTNAFMSFTDATISSRTINGEVGTMTWSGEWTATPSIDANTLRVGNMNPGTVALVGETAGAKDIVTITFDLGILQLVNRDIRFFVYDTDGTAIISETFGVAGTNTGYPGFFTNTLGLELSDMVSEATGNPGIRANNKNTFTITLNYATQKMAVNIVNKNGSYNHQVDMPDKAKAVGSFGVGGNYNNADRRCYFDNLKITTQIGDYAAVSTTYTVKYKSGGVEIKDEATGRVGDVGATPVLEAGDMETFYSADGSKKYVYDSDDASTTTIAAGGTTVVTVNFTTYEKRNYTINAVDEDETVLGELATGYVYADNTSVTVNIPWYVAYSGTLYNHDGNSANFDIDSDGKVSTVDYTATATTNVVYYSEGENITGCTGIVTNNNASNRGIGRFANEITYTTLGTGSYTVYLRAHSGNASGGTAIFKVGDVEFARKDFAGATINQNFQADFALTGSTDMKFQYNSGNATGLDYIYIVKKSDDPTLSAAITAAGWATLFTPYALDFSGVTGLTAYTAACDGSKVTLTQVNDVPAGTGVVLEGNADTYSIPVVASSSTAQGDLTGNASAATAFDAFSGYDLYMLAQNGENVQFKKVISGSVAAGKAFLKVSNGGDARALDVVFAGETTSISEECRVKSEEFATAPVYNLNGQRVEKAQKGLYIVNGKKVVVK